MTRTRFSVSIALAVAVLALWTTSCSSASDGDVTADGKTIIRYQGSPASVQWSELAESLGYYSKIKLKWLGDTTSGPQDIQSVATGATDTGAAFNGSVAKLVHAGSKVTAVVSSQGSDDKTFFGYYSLAGSGINTARDLVGRKVGINTLGAYHEYTIKAWLQRQGVSAADIDKVNLTVVPPINTEAALRQRQIDVGNLGTVFKDVAVASGGLHEVFRDTSLVGNIAIATQVFRDDYIAEHPDAVADYVQGYARAIRWAQLHPRQEVIDKFVSIISARGRNEDTKFVKTWKSAGVSVPGGVVAPTEFSLWLDTLSRLGDLPFGIKAESLYTNRFNPYANGTYRATANEQGV
ncbi:ABC transporter substrate-binding protein [Gordonia sp. CPCC 205333]|uniref:ABC transporter substrate-binding protein n=1 Tax=Gordonia sp. CPCC 205333 TaxID=3140790 RepID=UPI003AF345A9